MEIFVKKKQIPEEHKLGNFYREFWNISFDPDPDKDF